MSQVTVNDDDTDPNLGVSGDLTELCNNSQVGGRASECSPHHWWDRGRFLSHDYGVVS